MTAPTLLTAEEIAELREVLARVAPATWVEGWVGDRWMSAAEVLPRLLLAAGRALEAEKERAHYERIVPELSLKLAIFEAEATEIAAAAEGLAKALERVITNDRTTYRHHQPRPSDGKRPGEVDGGSIFLTPKEIASAALAAWRSRGGVSVEGSTVEGTDKLPANSHGGGGTTP